MSYKKTLLIIVGIFLFFIFISNCSAVDVDNALNDDNPNNLHCQKDLYYLSGNGVMKSCESTKIEPGVYETDENGNTHVYVEHSTRVTAKFSEKEIKKAKSSRNGVTKNAIGKVKVKMPIKKYKTVKKVKKFTCWVLNKNKLKMDKNYLKNYYKYQSQGYKINKGKWIGNKCIFTATKKVKKVVGYKFKWVKSNVKSQLFYSKGGMYPKGWYISFYPTKYHGGAEYFKTYNVNKYFWIQ